MIYGLDTLLHRTAGPGGPAHRAWFGAASPKPGNPARGDGGAGNPFFVRHTQAPHCGDRHGTPGDPRFDPMALVRMSGADDSSDDTVFVEQSQLRFDFLRDSVTTGLTPS